jgi:hypothetical protein
VIWALSSPAPSVQAARVPSSVRRNRFELNTGVPVEGFPQSYAGNAPRRSGPYSLYSAFRFGPGHAVSRPFRAVPAWAPLQGSDVWNSTGFVVRVRE